MMGIHGGASKLSLFGRSLGEGGVREKHARLLDRLGDNIGPEAVGAVIKAVRTAHLRTNRNSAICG